MAFENVIITKENDEKYGLSALYGKYNYGAKLPNLNFTIDRQLDCWLLKIYSFPDPNYDRTVLSKSLWILHYNNRNIEIMLDYNFNIDSTISPKKFHRIWKVLGLKPSLNSKAQMQNIFHLLQKSLEAYGDYDAWQSDPNYTMELQDLTYKKEE